MQSRERVTLALNHQEPNHINDPAPGGGFVFAAVHNSQAFVPPGNIDKMFETALEHGKY